MVVLLERKIDELFRVMDLRLLDHGAHALSAHARDQPLFDVGVAKMEKMARIIPDEAVARDRATVAARLAFGLEHDVVRAFEVRRKGEAGDAGADHQKSCLVQKLCLALRS